MVWRSSTFSSRSRRISIARDTLYTSATVLLTGVAFLGVALTALAFRWLRLDITYFERFLATFTLGFPALLVLGSGTMRRRIIRFANRHLYSRKYAYQDQFFRLHKTTVSGADVDSALTELVEKMGGRILCHSQPGRGTEFCNLLPAAGNPPNDGPGPREKA